MVTTTWCTVISAIMPPPLDEKGGIIAEKVFPLFSENYFGAYFGLVMYIWELIDVTEKVAFQMSNNNIYLAVLMKEIFRGAYLR